MYNLASTLVVVLYAVSATAGPVSQDAELAAPKTDESLVAAAGGDLPVVTLPYGKYKASSYDSINDVRISPALSSQPSVEAYTNNSPDLHL